MLLLPRVRPDVFESICILSCDVLRLIAAVAKALRLSYDLRLGDP